MAQIFGIEYATPAEIKAARNARYEEFKAQVADNPNALAQISAQQSIANAFRTAEETKAAQLENTLGTIMRNNQQMEGEDDFDYQARVAKEIRDRVAAFAPEVALQANEQVLQTAKAKQAMARLKTQNEAERLALDEEVYEARAKKSPVIFGFKNGIRTPIKRFPPETPLEVVQAAVRDVQGEFGSVYEAFDIGTAVDMWELEDLDTAGEAGEGSRFNKSTAAAMRTAVTTAKGFAENSASLLDDVIRSPYAAAEVVGTGAGILEAVNTGFEGIKSMFADWTRQQGGDPERALRIMDQENAAAQAKAAAAFPESTYGRDANIIQAKVLGLAYQLAKTLDPSGRLSDQDVNMAIRMLSGRGSPQELERLLMARLDQVHSGVVNTIENINEDTSGQFGEADKREAARYEQARRVMHKKILQLRQSLEEERKSIEAARSRAGGEAAQDAAAKREALRRRLRRSQ